ncbi:ADP-forming succinate--CoA ligase subunit beta [Variovorax sp. J2P1-59]|uniref:ADP-forming succinate--CoA ligase subunit beta n=1 Tax=Variovorax flavidus TaxID=3053501 RepID=UPI002578AE0C|nr:ADP-forming succinate--CoA ligase subunit beta [Variovorax sp. J2P1-59]MDM0076017.1 ADP-forming succinate--CoA ligase subunit beta [Variovorax sp. J2P1-59]
MTIHEYQAKELLRKYGVATPRGLPCSSADEAAEAATRLGGRAWVVKAQMHVRGRGKAGGVKQAWSVADVRRHAEGLLGSALRTQQTGPEGRVVKRLLVEEGVEIGKKLYLGMAVDRESGCVAVMASGQAGIELREKAASLPEKVHKLLIDPAKGLKAADADALARDIGLAGKSIAEANVLLRNLYQAFDASDASRLEIDPLVLTREGRLIALDASFDFDSNALFRQPAIAAMRDRDEEDPAEFEAADGNIGCIVNGPGLTMATMDMIRFYGGTPASFHDVGSAATDGKLSEAFEWMSTHPRVQAILLSIFGGVTSCDVIAHGVIAAIRKAGRTVPLVVHMRGTDEKLGRAILAESGLPVMNANGMAEAAELVVTAARRKI